MNLQKLLSELDAIYETDPNGQWSGHRAAAIVNEVSAAMATQGHAELVRAPLPDCDVIDAKRFLAACIAAAKANAEKTEPAQQSKDIPLKPTDVAKLLSVSPATVIDWIRTNQLKASNLASGNRPRYAIRREDLDAFLKMRQPEPPVRRSKRNRPA